MVLYSETKKGRVSLIYFITGVVAALVFIGVSFFVPLPEGAKISKNYGIGTVTKEAIAGQTLYQQDPTTAIVFSCAGAPFSFIVCFLLGISSIKITRVTKDEIVSMSLLGKVFPKLAWHLPTVMIAEATVMDFEMVMLQLNKDLIPKNALVRKVNGQIVSIGGDVPFRVRRDMSETSGVMIILGDGKSVFLGSSSPEKLCAAIQEARSMNTMTS